MKKRLTLTSLILTATILSPALQAWYPEYSVLATDFPVRDDFLRPLSMNSAALQGLGPYFQYLYPVQPNLRFLDPSYPLGKKGHIFYMDLGAENLWNHGEGSTISPPYYLYESSSMYIDDYAFWSPYRDLSHETIPEPSLRLFYLQRMGSAEGALTLGASYSLAYDETQFYQPYNFDYFRSYDAMGAAYDESSAYEDYRLKEAGQDESVSTEHQFNFFASKALSKRLSLGARLGLVNARVDGNYGDYQYNDRSDWADEYESYWDEDLERLQTQKMTDINLGLAYTTERHQRFALSGGVINGQLERSFAEMDTNRYYSITLNPDDNTSTLDTNIYRSTSYFRSAKEWLYDGQGSYLRLLAELPQEDDLILRFAGSVEWRSADLTESEHMLRRSDYYNQYWADWESLWRHYSSRSSVQLDRSGTGKYSTATYQLSAGADWQLQPALKFYGGLYLEYYDRLQDAREPFSGDKWAYTQLQGYGNPYETLEATQHDLKTFVWEQHQRRTTIAAPLGVEYQLLPALGIQLGLTKVFQRVRITEGYDVIVEEFQYTEREDGVVTRNDVDGDYVDGYQYPDMKDFSDRFDFNAGVNIRSGDKLRIYVVLSSISADQLAIKVGGSLTW